LSEQQYVKTHTFTHSHITKEVKSQYIHVTSV
jgi:hypothetical protein